MPNWQLSATDEYERAYKHYEKKHPRELRAVLDNLERYLIALCICAHPQFIVAGYIHPEPKGVKALDQRGKGNGNLAETRLYVFPDEGSCMLHLITIGDKRSQKTDLELAVKFVSQLKGE
jgi:hypothetical protein